MPRHARLDAPGALHHVIGRGIERQSIVQDDTDRTACVEHRGRVVAATGTPGYAWTLRLKAGHLLLRTGGAPPMTVRRRLLCYGAVREVGLPGTAVAARLGLTQSAVSRAVRREERLVREQDVAFPQG